MADVLTALPAVLHNRNYTLIYAPTQLTRSGMTPGFEHRWHQARTTILTISEQCHALAPDGLTVYRKRADADSFQAHHNVSVANLKSLMDWKQTL